MATPTGCVNNLRPFRPRQVKGPSDGKKESCKTYIEQTKLLVTLASAFLIAPASIVAFFSEKNGYSIGWGGIIILLLAEICFVFSVIAGYVVLGSVAGSQAADMFDVYRPVTMKTSLIQLGLYIAGLVFFIILTIVVYLAASSSHAAGPSDAPIKEQPPSAPPPPTRPTHKNKVVLAYYPFWFSLASGSAPNFTSGVRLDGNQLRELAGLVQALGACVGSNEKENVELGVRGFADPNMFRGDSGQRNVLVANARARELRAAIMKLLPPQAGRSQLIVDPIEKNVSQGEMERVQGYYQTEPLSRTGLRRDQGWLNRRAEILVKSSGVCGVTAPD